MENNLPDDWISVNDRLPTEEDVANIPGHNCWLIAFDEPFMGKAYTKHMECAYYCFEDKTWISNLTEREIIRVTHWRPLPPLPLVTRVIPDNK